MRSGLLRRLRNWEDQSGWQEFFVTYWKPIDSVALKAGLSDAEAHDVVQETVMGVARQMREQGFDRQRNSFKNWLRLITRRRIIDHLRLRKPDRPNPQVPRSDSTEAGTSPLHQVPGPASVDLDAVWAEGWRKNLVDIAIERIKPWVSAKQFQIFDLYVLKAVPLSEVTRALHVSVTLVYVTKHRVSSVVKREVRRLEQQSE
jgi:RNA polymerase sigma-70 factor (ECF subfamily)